MASQSTQMPHRELPVVAESSKVQKANSAGCDRRPRSSNKNIKSLKLPVSAILARQGPFSKGLPRPGRPFTPATYPPLPPNFVRSPRHWLLGWNLEEPWAEEFCRTRVSPEIRTRVRMQAALLQYVLQYTRCRPVISVQPALASDAKIVTVSDIQAGLAKKEDAREEDIIALLTICSTITKALYEEKLSKKVYDWLVARFGEPKWYRNVYTKEVAAEAYYTFL